MFPDDLKEKDEFIPFFKIILGKIASSDRRPLPVSPLFTPFQWAYCTVSLRYSFLALLHQSEVLVGGLKNILIMLLFQEWVTPTALLAATAYVWQPQQLDHHHQPKNFNLRIETCFDFCTLLKLNKNQQSVLLVTFVQLYLEKSWKLTWSGIVQT